MPEAAMNSPHTLRRGKRAFSSTTTEWPARARSSAAVAPAGPPPVMRTSTFMRAEEVSERPRHLSSKRQSA